MTFAEFHNGLRILINIDRWELEEAGVLKTRGPIFNREERWKAFRENPYRFFIGADTPTAKKLWDLIQKRMRP